MIISCFGIKFSLFSEGYIDLWQNFDHKGPEYSVEMYFLTKKASSSSTLWSDIMSFDAVQIVHHNFLILKRI